MRDTIKSNIFPNHILTHIPRSEHKLSRHNISQAALDVLYHLNQAGYQAFLVGGGVRDLILERVPKDFDIVTNAHPEQIKRLFKRCRLIGRRFLLAHVHVKSEIIEVATFRAPHDQSGHGSSKNGLIVRDNVYGSSVNDDAQRRDFTINAIYYDISDFSLFDYANGMADLRQGVIRLMGDPVLRYQEDPVRMLRAVRFSAKLGFSIHPETAAPIRQLSGLLSNIPPARLFEEVLKLFNTGHAAQSFEQMRTYDLFEQLFPYTERCLADPLAFSFIQQALDNTDKRKKNQDTIMPVFLFAVFLWLPLSRELPKKIVKGLNQQEILFNACQQLLAKQQKYVTIPRRFTVLMQDIWFLQIRLTHLRRGKKKTLSILEHPNFRAAYDFLKLRVKAGDEAVAEDLEWWDKFLSQHKKGHHTEFSAPTPKWSRRRQKSDR